MCELLYLLFFVWVFIGGFLFFGLFNNIEFAKSSIKALIKILFIAILCGPLAFGFWFVILFFFMSEKDKEFGVTDKIKEWVLK